MAIVPRKPQSHSYFLSPGGSGRSFPREGWLPGSSMCLCLYMSMCVCACLSVCGCTLYARGCVCRGCLSSSSRVCSGDQGHGDSLLLPACGSSSSFSWGDKCCARRGRHEQEGQPFLHAAADQGIAGIVCPLAHSGAHASSGTLWEEVCA